MPLYDYACLSCGHEFEEARALADRTTARCPECGSETKQILKPGGLGVSVFREGWYNDVGPDPIYCRTPQELRNACDRNNAYSHYLENSLFRTSPGPDPERGT